MRTTLTHAQIIDGWYKLAEAAMEEVPQTGTYDTPLCNRVRKGYEWLKANLTEEEFEEVAEYVKDNEDALEGIAFPVERRKESKSARLHAEYCEMMGIRYDARKRDYVRF